MRYAWALLAAILPTAATAQADWNARAAATYLDDRVSHWLSWPNAARDHGTSCVSCHTGLPYALARGSLRRALHESARPAPEDVMLEQVSRRVRLWREVEPYYSDQRNGLPKTSESRGTEAVISAVVLATRDAEQGAVSDELREAFSNLWALQMRRGPLQGAWAWLEFGLEPWEGPASSYFGAAMAAIAVGTAPGDYAAAPEIQEQLNLLRGYLRNGADDESLHTRLMILWASGELPGILDESQRRAVVAETLAAQRPDGGWSVAALAPWRRLDGSDLPAGSDAYATALAVVTLQKAGGVAAAPSAERGRAWLIAHQDPHTGAFPAWSINRERDPATEPAKFMSDAATALAALALSGPR